jgi:hypothetical protein
MRFRLFFLSLICASLCACTSLLPRSSSDTPTPFNSFEQARDAAERVVALQTHSADLKALGFDLRSGTNVTLIPYPEIVARLTPHPAVPLDKLDAGIAQCIDAQTACRGHLFHFERQDRKREGGFWLDFLNVRRTTRVSGWWFEILVVMNDDTVLFRNIAGQAHTERVEEQTNPLGPFQPAGEGAAAALLR